MQSHTNALGGTTTTLYTSTGKPEFRSNADGSTNGWLYYLDGRTYREIQGNGAYWQSTYDDVNRITTRIFYSAAGVPEATNSVQLIVAAMSFKKWMRAATCSAPCLTASTAPKSRQAPQLLPLYKPAMV